MDIRVLKYFLAIAREESLSGAAEILHITQPTLSRQIMELEEELGCKLLIRGNRKISLTEDGMFLRKRAEEISSLFDRTLLEFESVKDIISGDIYIGGGESEAMSLIAKTIKRFKNDFPNVHFHLYSGNSEDVSDRLDKGLLDFGLLLEPCDIRKYDFIRLNHHDTWGLLMKKDSPIANKTGITPDDLCNLPILTPRNSLAANEFSNWCKENYEKLNIVASFNLIYNASLLVREDIGYALCLDKLVNTSCESDLCFVPLVPNVEVGLDLVWKKHKSFSKAATKFLDYLKEDLQTV